MTSRSPGQVIDTVRASATKVTLMPRRGDVDGAKTKMVDESVCCEGRVLEKWFLSYKIVFLKIKDLYFFYNIYFAFV